MRGLLLFKKMEIQEQGYVDKMEWESTFVISQNGKILQADERAMHILRKLKNEIIDGLGNKKLSFRWRGMEISIYPIFERGHVTKYFGLIRKGDTETIEEYINKTYEIMNNFKENISHYFFNPIVIAKGYIDLMLDESKNAGEKQKLKKIKNAIERIEAVVKNTIMYGKIIE